MSIAYNRLTELAQSGRLTGDILLDQMIEDRKTASSYDSTEYGSEIEAYAAWWCLNTEHQKFLRPLPEVDRRTIVMTILKETAWGPSFFQDFDHNVFDNLARLTSRQFVFEAGAVILQKSGWITWACTHFDRSLVRQVVTNSLTTPKVAEEFYGADGYNPVFWSLFETESLFLAAINIVAKSTPSKTLLNWPWIAAFLVKVGSGQPVPQNPDRRFLPHNRDEVEQIAVHGIHKILPILEEAFSHLQDGDRIHPRFLKPLPLNLRLTALKHVKRLDEGIELSIQLLFDLRQEDKWSRQVLDGLLSRMTPWNAGPVYVHALAERMEGDGFGYWQTTPTKGGKHHTSRGQAAIWDNPDRGTQWKPRKSLVKDTWFYPELRKRVIDCGWAFRPKTDLDWSSDFSGGEIRFELDDHTSMILQFLPIMDDAQWYWGAAGLEILIPTTPWRAEDKTYEFPERKVLVFEGLVPIFDTPARMHFLETIEEKVQKTAEARAERRGHRR